MISAIVVSYFSGDLARGAIESLRQDARSSGLELEVLCVVNSGDASEAALVRDVSDVVIVPETNTGYGGGLNLGSDRARGEILLFTNPDIVFRSGSLAALSEPLHDPARRVMTGPALFWDEAETLRIPPAVRPSPAEFARRAIAVSRGKSRLFFRDLRLALEQARVVDRGENLPRPALSGAVLAVHRKTFRMVGPFNEAYRLYYEENDWQERLCALGGGLLLAGGARVVHHFNQSARKEPKAAGWFAASESRFLRAYFGETGEKARRLLEGVIPYECQLRQTPRLELPERGRVAVAVSPAAYFRPFALALLSPGTRSFELPGDVRSGIDAESWFARAIDLDTLSILAEGQISGGMPGTPSTSSTA